MPVGLQPAVLLGAFVGLRLAEAAALRPEDVDFMRGIVTPSIHWPAEPLKSETVGRRCPSSRLVRTRSDDLHRFLRTICGPNLDQLSLKPLEAPESGASSVTI